MRSVLAAGLSVLLFVGLLSCGGAPPTRIDRDNAVGRRVAARERSDLAGGKVALPGDYVLENENLRVLVGGLGRKGVERGALLEIRLRSAGSYQSLTHWSFGLNIKDRGIKLTPIDLHLIERNGQPAVRFLTAGWLGDRVVHVDREVALAAVDGVLNVSSSVWTESGDPIEDARIVERVDWEGATPFAPGVGEIVDEEIHRVPWLARDGRSSALVLGYLQGALHVKTSFQPHGADRLPGSTTVLSPAGIVNSGEAMRLQAFVALAHYGVSDALRRFGWARGKPFAEANVHLPYVPAGTLARVYHNGVVQVRGRPGPDGNLVMPLPDPPSGSQPFKLTIAATAWGHAATVPVSIVANQRVVLNIPRGGSVHVVVRDRDGRNMPGRIRFESIDRPVKKIDLGPDYNASGARDTVITVNGDVEIPLMAGRFIVRVSRGPEYSLFEETIEVTESFQPQVGAKLERVLDPGAWIGSDFHLHSSPSPDSQVTLEDRVASLAAEGVRFAVPTDHDHVTSLIEAIQTLGVRDFGTVSGVEVTTAEPIFGHFNAYPYPLDPSQPGNGAPSPRGLTGISLFDQLHQVTTNPLVQVNHPRMEGGIGYFDAYAFDPHTGQAREGFSESFDVLEVWNGFDLARPAVYEQVFREWLAILMRGNRIVATGNSDSHSVRYQWAGYPRTFVNAPEGPSQPDAVIAALRAGRAFVSDGPFLEVTIDGHGPGELVPAANGKVKVRVHVRAAPWMDVSTLECWVGETLVRSEPIVLRPAKNARRGAPAGPRPVERLLKEIELPITQDSFVVVRVSGAEPMNAYFARNDILPGAFTNPIFIDADGDAITPWIREPSTTVDAGSADAHVTSIPTHTHGSDTPAHTHGPDTHTHESDTHEAAHQH